MNRKQFRFRFEELPALGEFVESSFLRDKDLFAAFSPVYANGYAENYHSKLQTVKDITSPEVVTGRRKRVTESLHAAQESLITTTENIKRYCQMAGDKLGFPVDELKLSELRKNLRNRNSEAAVKGARMMQQVLKGGITALEEQGFTAERQEELNKLIDSLESLNLEQYDLLYQRMQLVEDNTTLFNEFWNMVQDIMKTGQIIHRDNPVCKKQYTEKNIKSQLRLTVSSKPEEAAETPAEPASDDQPVAA